MKTTTRQLAAYLGEKGQMKSSDPRVIVRHLKSWHAEAMRLKSRWLAFTYAVGGNSMATMVVGLGEPKGLYLLCEYSVEPIWSLFAVRPGGLARGRKMIEFDDREGNPHEAPVQCLVPFKAGFSAVEYFLTHGGLPLTLEWVSERGLRYKPLTR